MKFRLLVDVDVFAFIKTLPRVEQRTLDRRFRQIQELPTRFSDYHEYASAGHRVEISICDRFAISYTIDHLDRHVKILDIGPADRK